MPNSITISGFEQFITKCNKLPGELLEDFDEAADINIHDWERLAKLSAPKNFGFLAGGISSKKNKPGDWELVSAKYYSPYQEWGTGSRAVIPAELVAYAAQWWTHKVHTGIHPHPFFFIHKPFIETQFIGDLKQIIETPR